MFDALFMTSASTFGSMMYLFRYAGMVVVDDYTAML